MSRLIAGGLGDLGEAHCDWPAQALMIFFVLPVPLRYYEKWSIRTGFDD